MQFYQHGGHTNNDYQKVGNGEVDEKVVGGVSQVLAADDNHGDQNVADGAEDKDDHKYHSRRVTDIRRVFVRNRAADRTESRVQRFLHSFIVFGG